MTLITLSYDKPTNTFTAITEEPRETTVELFTIPDGECFNVCGVELNASRRSFAHCVEIPASRT